MTEIAVIPQRPMSKLADGVERAGTAMAAASWGVSGGEVPVVRRRRRRGGGERFRAALGRKGAPDEEEISFSFSSLIYQLPPSLRDSRL